jgi:glycine cleavage system H lipoate-binding protein
LLKVKITDPSQVDELLSAEDYEKYVKEETH